MKSASLHDGLEHELGIVVGDVLHRHHLDCTEEREKSQTREPSEKNMGLALVPRSMLVAPDRGRPSRSEEFEASHEKV